MKLSTLLLSSSTALLALSMDVTANVKKISGTFDSYNAEQQTISIVHNKSGDLVTYKFSESADVENLTGRDIKMSTLRKGTDVTLKLEAK